MNATAAAPESPGENQRNNDRRNRVWVVRHATEVRRVRRKIFNYHTLSTFKIRDMAAFDVRLGIAPWPTFWRSQIYDRSREWPANRPRAQWSEEVSQQGRPGLWIFMVEFSVRSLLCSYVYGLNAWKPTKNNHHQRIISNEFIFSAEQTRNRKKP